MYVETQLNKFPATAEGALGQHTEMDPETGYPIVDHKLKVLLQVSNSA